MSTNLQYLKNKYPEAREAISNPTQQESLVLSIPQVPQLLLEVLLHVSSPKKNLFLKKFFDYVDKGGVSKKNILCLAYSKNNKVYNILEYWHGEYWDMSANHIEKYIDSEKNILVHVRFQNDSNLFCYIRDSKLTTTLEKTSDAINFLLSFNFKNIRTEDDMQNAVMQYDVSRGFLLSAYSEIFESLHSDVKYFPLSRATIKESFIKNNILLDKFTAFYHKDIEELDLIKDPNFNRYEVNPKLVCYFTGKTMESYEYNLVVVKNYSNKEHMPILLERDGSEIGCYFKHNYCVNFDNIEINISHLYSEEIISSSSQDRLVQILKTSICPMFSKSEFFKGPNDLSHYDLSHYDLDNDLYHYNLNNSEIHHNLHLIGDL